VGLTVHEPWSRAVRTFSGAQPREATFAAALRSPQALRTEVATSVREHNHLSGQQVYIVQSVLTGPASSISSLSSEPLHGTQQSPYTMHSELLTATLNRQQQINYRCL
jgi:hypothetical protein